ncbi:right-handed parallel beta-helix repeat-containing protein [uncultured Parabacteroides sp.]|uniref:right-handed parallel beta-helix repeat-containing protein n=1 Tax=uncultured Parabacteroides sp. TaxID=512312 RepID=UPI00262098A0|nr:right-handed parallel beta-helix repeat-containing protein [uncultured Parabacteroides sp.]
MKRLTITLFILAIFLLNMLPACDGLDDNYSTNPTYRLSFSTDTLAFDTIFSTIGSTTRQFMIYNKNSEPLNIESIMLASGEATGFRMNVDGRKGSSFNNVGILANDSMYVFVEVTVDPNGGNQPLLIQDSVLFTVNGIRQSVLLEAYGQDVNLYKGGVTITKDSTLTANRPYLIYDSLVIANGVSLNIEKGAIFYMHDKANLVVHGSMNALGTLDEPITFRGDRLDYILNDILPYDRTPGQWGGIIFKANSHGNVWDNVIVRNGTSGIYCEPSTTDRPKIKINNSQITNMGSDLFFAVNCDIIATNTEFSNAGGSVLVLVGGKYYFAHCTMANYMSLTKREMASETVPLDSKCLYLLNNVTIDGNGPYPITQAYFDNCIIDGSHDAGDFKTLGEIEISSNKELSTKADGDTDFDYQFNHCVLKAEETSSEHFKEVLFIKKTPSYRKIGGKSNKYIYDFRPDSVSTTGVGKADPEITKNYPIDRYGVNRLTSSNGPTIGAYEFVQEETENSDE